MKRKWMLVLVVLGVISIQIGCANKDTSQKNEVTLTHESMQSEDEEQIMFDFYTLVYNKDNFIELRQYVSENVSKVSIEKATEMVLELEKKHREHEPVFGSRFFDGDNQQSFLNAEFNQEYDSAYTRLTQQSELGWYKIQTQEGLYFPAIDYTKYKEFKPYVDKKTNQYIDEMIESKE